MKRRAVGIAAGYIAPALPRIGRNQRFRLSMTQSNRPLLAITMGDPAGVGPEVIVGAWSNAHTAWYARPAGARTAIGSGFVAFATEAEARAADAASRAVRFDEILQHAGEAR